MSEREEVKAVLAGLEKQIDEIEYKIHEGRVRDVEKEKIRVKYHRININAYQTKLDVLTELGHVAEVDDSGKSLYLISGAGLHKIGISKNPKNRLRQIQNMSPMSLSLRYKTKRVDCAERIESHLHEKYGKYRQHGEWFDFPDSILADVIGEMEGMTQDSDKQIQNRPNA